MSRVAPRPRAVAARVHEPVAAPVSAPAYVGLAVKDVNFSFKLFHRSLLQKFELKSEGSFIDAEFLIRARKAGATLVQIGVDYFPRSRGVSTLSSPGVILTILREMARLWGELR